MDTLDIANIGTGFPADKARWQLVGGMKGHSGIEDNMRTSLAVVL